MASSPGCLTFKEIVPEIGMLTSSVGNLLGVEVLGYTEKHPGEMNA